MRTTELSQVPGASRWRFRCRLLLALVLLAWIGIGRSVTGIRPANAEDLAQPTNDSPETASDQARAVEAHIRTGDFREAKAAAAAMDDEDEKARAYGSIAKAQAAAGDVAEAKHTAQQIRDRMQKASALAVIARTQAEAGKISAAKATAAGIPLLTQSAMAYRWIATAQVEAGDLEGAKRTLRQISQEDERALARQAIAAAEARAGGAPEATPPSLEKGHKVGKTGRKRTTLAQTPGGQNEADPATPTAGAQPEPGESDAAPTSQPPSTPDPPVAVEEPQETGTWDFIAIRNSLTLRLAHHAPVGQLKERWKAPLEKHARLSTGSRDIGVFSIPQIRKIEEWVVGSADDGDRIYLLLHNPSRAGDVLLNPTVSKWRLVCFTANGSELWNKDLQGTWLQAIAPAGPGVLVQKTGPNDEQQGGIYVSPTGEIRLLQGEETSHPGYRDHTLCVGMRRGDFWPWEMFGAQSTFAQSVIPQSGFLKEEFNQGKVTLVSPSKTCCTGWSEPRDFWCRRNADGSGALYEIVWQQNTYRMLRLDLATRELRVQSLYYDENYRSRYQNPEAVTRRCLGVLDDGAVWVEETVDGMLLHSTDLRSGKDRTLRIPSARVPLQYQLTWDGKLFFHQGYRSAGYRMEAGSQDPDAWYFVANVRRMHANPEPGDAGPQTLWVGHARRIMCDASLYVLQDTLPEQDDAAHRQEALKAESSAIEERRAVPSQRQSTPPPSKQAPKESSIGAARPRILNPIVPSPSPEALRSVLNDALTRRPPMEGVSLDAVPFELREGVVAWAAEVMKTEHQTVVAGGEYGDEAKDSFPVTMARAKRKCVFLFASELGVPAVLDLVRQAAKDPDPIVRRDAWPKLWMIGESADMPVVEACYASLPAYFKEPGSDPPPPKTQLRREQLLWRNWDGSPSANTTK